MRIRAILTLGIALATPAAADPIQPAVPDEVKAEELERELPPVAAKPPPASQPVKLPPPSAWCRVMDRLGKPCH